MDPTTIRLVCVVLVVVFGAAIFMRRRRKADWTHRIEAERRRRSRCVFSAVSAV